jgi:hypothetical protein
LVYVWEGEALEGGRAVLSHPVIASAECECAFYTSDVPIVTLVAALQSLELSVELLSLLSVLEEPFVLLLSACEGVGESGGGRESEDSEESCELDHLFIFDFVQKNECSRYEE